MMNFFLLNEAIDVPNNVFIEGMTLLESIEYRQQCQCLKHESVWNLPQISWLYATSTQVNQVIVGYLVKLSNSSEYIGSEAQFALQFPNDCNGFLGIDFTNTTIAVSRQVKDEDSYQLFESQYIATKTYHSIDDFWNTKETFFPRLVFCERVYAQVEHLSVNDNRFKQIIEKLKVLNSFTSTWSSGNFNYKNLGLDNSPDTPLRIKATLDERTFDCPTIGKQVFSLHIKWYVGGEPFRLYYYPSDFDYKVYVGYIGNKSDIGF